MSNGFETCDQHTYLFATEGKDCPYCEIDRLKGELEEARDEAFKREARIMMYVNQVCALEHHLAEARAEVDRIKQVEFPRRVEKLRTDTCKQVAQDIVDMLRADRWADSELKEIIEKFELEG